MIPPKRDLAPHYTEAGHCAAHSHIHAALGEFVRAILEFQQADMPLHADYLRSVLSDAEARLRKMNRASLAREAR